MYATVADMINRYGEEELIQTTDKSETQTNAIVTARIQAAIDGAEAELNLILSCCYNLKTIKTVYDNERFIPILKHWTCYITRKHLYTDLENGENQVTRDYKDFEEEVKKTCKCSDLYDNELNVVSKKGFSMFMEDPGCYPPAPCCCDDACCCSGCSK